MIVRFPGQYADRETGTFYNYFRTYDPSTARYLESDPIGLRGGINTYSYVRGNPLSRIDAEGLSDLDGSGGKIRIPVPVWGPINPSTISNSSSETGSRELDEALSGGKGASNSSGVDEIDKHMEWLVNKFKCYMPPKPPWMSQCDYWKQKRGPLQACIDRKQQWDDKWESNKHADNINQMKAELANIDRLIEKLCKGDCP